MHLGSYLSYAGSRLYGTSTATSDLDMKGIYIPGPPSPKPGGTTAAAAAEGGNGGSGPLQQGRRALRETSSSVARSTSAGTSSKGTAGAEGVATPNRRVDGRNGTSSSFGFPRTTAPLQQTAMLRVDDDDWAFPAAERYSYSSANTSVVNTEDDIDLELLQRAEVSAIETLFSMENSAMSMVSDPKLVSAIRRESPALVCSNPTAWLGYASGHLAKFQKLCLQEAVARCALASAATAKRLRETGPGEIGSGDAEESGLPATDHGDFGGSSVADGAAGVDGKGVERDNGESMLYGQPGSVSLPSSASPDTGCVPGTEGSAGRGSEACPDMAGVVGGGAGAEDSAADSHGVTRSGVGEVDVPVRKTSNPTAQISENQGAGDILIENAFVRGGVMAGGDAGDGAQQQAEAAGGLRVEPGEVVGKAVAEAAIGEDDHRGEGETQEETIERVGKRVGKVISHAKRVIVEAEELLDTGRLTLPIDAHHIAEILTLKVDRMLQHRVEASLKAELRNLHKKAKASRLPSRVDRKHVIALRDEILALHESRGVPRRRKRRS